MHISVLLLLQDGPRDAADGEVTLLHMEDVPGRAQRCFAAVGCGIKVTHSEINPPSTHTVVLHHLHVCTCTAQ